MCLHIFDLPVHCVVATVKPSSTSLPDDPAILCQSSGLTEMNVEAAFFNAVLISVQRQRNAWCTENGRSIIRRARGVVTKQNEEQAAIQILSLDPFLFLIFNFWEICYKANV